MGDICKCDAPFPTQIAFDLSHFHIGEPAVVLKNFADLLDI
jgi:hypothetical protein